MTNFMDDATLERSSIVANNRMNRERQATGTNGYETDLDLNPIEFLHQRIANSSVRMPMWLDLCCGRGRAICETAQALADVPGIENAYFLGIDLVGMFDPLPADCKSAELIEASLHHWETTLQFDLITCSHGLHYLGAKLGVIARVASWLRPGGLFVANLDLKNLRIVDSNISIATRLRDAGFEYLKKKRLLRLQRNDSVAVDFRLKYLGASDEAGPNYTGQEAVNSYYEGAS